MLLAPGSEVVSAGDFEEPRQWMFRSVQDATQNVNENFGLRVCIDKHTLGSAIIPGVCT